MRLDFDEFALQPPLLGNCQYDKMWVTANGEYPLLCGQNSGQHIYLDVAGKSHTELTFSVDYLKDPLYSCPDRFGIAAETANVPYSQVNKPKIAQLFVYDHSTCREDKTVQSKSMFKLMTNLNSFILIPEELGISKSLKFLVDVVKCQKHLEVVYHITRDFLVIFGRLTIMDSAVIVMITFVMPNNFKNAQ